MLVVWLRCRADAGSGAVVGLFLGGLGGASLAAAVGLLLGATTRSPPPVGTITEGALDIRAWGVVLFEAGLAVTVWLLLDLLVLRDDDVRGPGRARRTPRTWVTPAGRRPS